MAYEQHKSEAQAIAARAAIVTLSDTRTPATDISGQAIRRLLEESEHVVAAYHLIKDEPTALSSILDELLAHADIDIVLTNGGTGISPRDQTIDVVERVIEKPLPGFGELFRMLSWEQIGSG